MHTTLLIIVTLAKWMLLMWQKQMEWSTNNCPRNFEHCMEQQILHWFMFCIRVLLNLLIVQNIWLIGALNNIYKHTYIHIYVYIYIYYVYIYIYIYLYVHWGLICRQWPCPPVCFQDYFSLVSFLFHIVCLLCYLFLMFTILHSTTVH